MSKNTKSIEEKITDLEQQVAWFDGEDFKIEEAIDKYKSAKEIAEAIQKDIDELKNEVKLINRKDE